MKRIKIITLMFLFSILLFAFQGVLGFGEEEPLKGLDEPKIPFAPKKYICYRTDSVLEINGKLDEKSWKEAQWTDYFQDIEGSSKPAPRYKTHIKMLWDDNYLYIGAELEEPHVWATLTEEDSIIFRDNDFEIFIDKDGNTHNYFEMEFNAFGTIWDLFLDKPYRDNGNPLYYWNMVGIKKAVFVDGTINNSLDKDKGWTLELALPWAVLQSRNPDWKPPVNGEQWRMNFSRVEWKTHFSNNAYIKDTDPKTGTILPENNWVWSPQGLIQMHYPEMWGFVQFSAINAGQGTGTFTENEEEQIKWFLRRVYYRERNFYEKNNHYTENQEELGIKELKETEWVSSLVIKCTWNDFEARCTDKAGKAYWFIRSDGKTYKQTKDR